MTSLSLLAGRTVDVSSLAEREGDSMSKDAAHLSSGLFILGRRNKTIYAVVSAFIRLGKIEH